MTYDRMLSVIHSPRTTTKGLIEIVNQANYLSMSEKDYITILHHALSRTDLVNNDAIACTASNLIDKATNAYAIERIYQELRIGNLPKLVELIFSWIRESSHWETFFIFEKRQIDDGYSFEEMDDDNDYD